MDFPECSHDSSFGPFVHGCRGDFDFTLKFERIFFSTIPAAVFITLALPRILILLTRSRVAGGKVLRLLKLGTTLTYATLRLALLVFGTSKASKVNSLFITSSAITLTATLILSALSFLEHSRSRRPSVLIDVYLLFATLFDIVQCRSIWLLAVTGREVTYTGLFTAMVAAGAILLIIESQDKIQIVCDGKSITLEETRSIWGLIGFTWLNQVFRAGYTKLLTLDDLVPVDDKITTGALQLKLMHKLENLHKSKPSARHGLGLAKALTKTLAVPLLLPVGPRLALIGFKFCQPFLIHTLLDYLKKPSNEVSKNIGYGLIGATIFIYSGIAVATSLYWYFHERSICMSRAALAGAIYRKTTVVPLSAAGDSEAITLMSTDIERIRLGFLKLHELWANTIEVGLAAWLLQRQLGAAFAAPLVVVVVCILAGGYVNRFTGKRQRAWMDKIQKRVGLTADVISNMKALKISGLTTAVEKLIQYMRVDELQTASKFRLVYVVVTSLGYAPTALAPVMTFAVTAKTLDPTTIFTSLSFLILLCDPLGYLFQNTPNFIAAFACLDRIQRFLEQEPRVDYRVSKSIESRDYSEKEISDSDDEKTDAVIRVTNGHFGWEQDKLSLEDINLTVSISQLTIVIGPVASGKSTLCKVLLGEIPFSQGQVTLGAAFVARRAGYCDQTPYLSNTTIRENIIGFSPFNQSRYNEVVAATMLQPDFAVLPKGDETTIGSNGISLSGGQKQRVTMARALYLDSNFYLFDDILSGLDADTEEQVFRRVFGPGGLIRRRNATAVFCTHTIRYLPFADHIVALAAGRIVEQGTYAELNATNGYVRSLDVKPSEEIQSLETEMAAHIGEELQETTQNPVEIAKAQTVRPKDTDRMLGDSTVYKHYLISLGRRSIAAFIIFGLGWGFFYNWSNIWLQFWSEDVTSVNPSHSNAYYIGLYALFQMSFLASLFFCFLVCFRTMIAVSGAALHKAALHTVINAPLKFFTTHDTGTVTTLFSQDMTLIDHELPIAVTNLALDICNALGMAAVIASSSPYLVIAYPFYFAILFGVQKVYLRTSRQIRLLDLEAKSPLYTRFLDTIKDVASVRALGWVEPGITTFNNLLDVSQKPTYILAMIQRYLLFVLQVLVAILALAVVTLATQLQSRKTALTGASLITLMTFGDILNYIIRWFTQIETSIGAVSRLKKFSEEVKGEDDREENVVPPMEWPLRGDIRMENISASYSDETETDPNFAIKDFTLNILPGEKMAICGRSGSGKSSLLLVILRLLDTYSLHSSSITIDSMPLHTISRTELRQRLIAIPQSPVFLPPGSSTLENLDPFLTASPAECHSSLVAVGLAFLAEQEGLDAPLPLSSLSLGQKQLFSLARAVLRRRVRARVSSANGGILLLDEVSSSVDQDTDRHMQRVIREEFKEFTIVMVAHRLEMVMEFDRVVVMDKGELMEVGKPRELVEQDGWFAALSRSGS